MRNVHNLRWSTERVRTVRIYHHNTTAIQFFYHQSVTRAYAKNTPITLIVAGLLVGAAADYLFTAYEEPIWAAHDISSSYGGVTCISREMSMSTLVQTALFFAIAGLASTSVAAWIIIITPRKRRIIQ